MIYWTKNEVTEPRPGWVCDHFLVPAGSVSKITVSSLTVGTSIGLQPQSHPPVGVPVGRDEPQEASDDRLLQFVLNHAVCIAVAGKGLDNTETARTACEILTFELKSKNKKKKNEAI